LKPYIPSLKEGEILCPVCNGRMCIETKEGAIGTCHRCLGKGKLDWVQAAMKKEYFRATFSVESFQLTATKPILPFSTPRFFRVVEHYIRTRLFKQRNYLIDKWTIK
jgi:hypothetical protein